jgi:hypothetical protein
MATSFGRYGATHPWLGALAERVSRPLLTAYAARHGFHAHSRAGAAMPSPKNYAAASASTSSESGLRAMTPASR